MCWGYKVNLNFNEDDCSTLDKEIYNNFVNKYDVMVRIKKDGSSLLTFPSENRLNKDELRKELGNIETLFILEA